MSVQNIRIHYRSGVCVCMCHFTSFVETNGSVPINCPVWSSSADAKIQFLCLCTLTLGLLMSCVYIYIYIELLVKLEILTSYVYMDLHLATLKALYFYLMRNVSTLNQCRKLSCGRAVCKLFAATKVTLITDGISIGTLMVNCVIKCKYLN
jgi:hypothetical protein